MIKTNIKHPTAKVKRGNQSPILRNPMDECGWTKRLNAVHGSQVTHSFIHTTFMEYRLYARKA